MKRFVVIAVAGCAAHVASTASPRLSRVHDRETAARLWSDVARSGAPVIEDAPDDPHAQLVTFVWRGDATTKNVVVFLQPGGPSPADNQMTRIDGTDVWYRTYRFRSDARLLYSLSPNDDLTRLDAPGLDFKKRFAHVQPDPLDPRRFPVKPAPFPPPQSVVELRDAPQQPWIAPREGIAKGHVDERTLGGRRYWIYTPARAATALIVIFDGQSYLDQVPTPTILDNLIADGKIPPAIAVFVDIPMQSREAELSCNPALGHELADGVLHDYAFDAAHTVIAGSSLGALEAACLAIAEPARFGTVLAMSGSFYWDNERVKRELSAAHLPLHFYLTVGVFETLPKPGNTTQLDVNRRLHDTLVGHGYLVTYAEFAGAHEYIDWQGSLPDGLVALLGG